MNSPKFLYFLIILNIIKKLNFQTKSVHKELLNDKIYELSDLTFEDTINAGKEYKWCLLFYLKTCGHCKRAKIIRDKIFKNVTDPKLRFAQIETEDNLVTNFRFNVNAVPYIVLIENNSMLELEKYPSEENLLKFCESNFSDFKNEIIPYPKPIGMGKVSWIMMKETLRGFVNKINEFLYKKNINYQIDVYQFICFLILLLIIVGFLEYYILSKCFDDKFDEEIENKIKLMEMEERKKKIKNKKNKEKKEKEKKEGKDEEKEKKEENKKEEEEEEKEEEEEEKKELNKEEKKIKEEEKKEKIFKEKNNNKKEEEKKITDNKNAIKKSKKD